MMYLMGMPSLEYGIPKILDGFDGSGQRYGTVMYTENWQICRLPCTNSQTSP